MLPEGDLAREELTGHFGNPIVSLAVRIERPAQVRKAWQRLGAVGGFVADRLDETFVYHLRFDKQRAFGGELVPTTTDDVVTVRGRVAAFPKTRMTAEQVLRESLEAT